MGNDHAQGACVAETSLASFGRCLQVPYGEVNSPFIVCCDVRNGVRLEIPDNARPEYAALIRECWAQNANERPSFQEILVRLEEMTDMVQQETGHEHAVKLQGPRNLRGSFLEVNGLATAFCETNSFLSPCFSVEF